ncbi:riboflavin transporter [Clostridia bacterium]|nr:riboflavin transporter [Clostridia bacterium]
MKPKFSVKKITVTAMLATISFILMLFEFAIPIFPSFLKLDLSDVPALFGSLAFGPWCGVFVGLIKNLIHLLRTSTAGIGELANFIITASLVFTAGHIYRKSKTRGEALLAMFAGVLAMTFVGAFANYFILFPIYTKFIPEETIIALCAAIIPMVKTLPQVILFTIVPFNLFKGIIIILVTQFLYGRLSKYIEYEE